MRTGIFIPPCYNSSDDNMSKSYITALVRELNITNIKHLEFSANKIFMHGCLYTDLR